MKGFSEPGSTGIPHGSTSDRPSTASSRFAVEALRFPDDMIVAFILPAGVNVTVLYISGDLLRIQWIDDSGLDRYGWVP